jgi:hypothetical protein
MSLALPLVYDTTFPIQIVQIFCDQYGLHIKNILKEGETLCGMEPGEVGRLHHLQAVITFGGWFVYEENVSQGVNWV